MLETAMDQPITKPSDAEMPEYYRYYVGLVPENDLLKGLKATSTAWEKLLSEVSMEQFQGRYAEGKWTLAEVLMHLMDTERIFAYRAFRFSRKDETVLPGFNENHYIQNLSVQPSNANPKQWLKWHRNLRAGTLDLFESLTLEQLDFQGNANGLKTTPRALGFMNSGHDLHHLKVIQERYF
jgi:uncharacterized damage-inducible protein DinB